MGKIVWIEGNVGMGKSTLARELNGILEAEYLAEPVDDNPYLADFYKNMKRWAFPMQMHLLYRRFDQHWYAQSHEGTFLFDRGITGDRIFADMLWADGFITDREMATYLSTHKTMSDKLIKPHVIVYLHGTPERAYKQLLKRNRSQEEGVPLAYLKRLDEYYKDIFFNRRPEIIQGVPVLNTEWYMNNKDDTWDLAEAIDEVLRRYVQTS